MPEKRQRLHWQQGFSLSRKPAKKSIARRRRQRRSADAPLQYEFVCEHPVGPSHEEEPRSSVRNSIAVFTTPQSANRSSRSAGR
ncbi:hypothetical protein PG993_014955 [Apiospora rasikravindrae]|uniref:Uncharacterized protein n=1 Tax=Apiospora rasikravindrae TaxID=990691 RepID=A0ABR1RP79_9PEZI